MINGPANFAHIDYRRIPFITVHWGKAFCHYQAGVHGLLMSLKSPQV